MTSEEVVRAYIERIQEVNPLINAVVEDRFEAAIEDAKRADKLVEITPPIQLLANYPILGVPFTVKESCSLKGEYQLLFTLTIKLQKKIRNNNNQPVEIPPRTDTRHDIKHKTVYIKYVPWQRFFEDPKIINEKNCVHIHR